MPDLTIYPAYDREGSKRLPKRVSEIGDAKFEVNKLLQLFFYSSKLKKSDSRRVTRNSELLALSCWFQANVAKMPKGLMPYL